MRMPQAHPSTARAPDDMDGFADSQMDTVRRHDDPGHDNGLCASDERTLAGEQSKSVVPVQKIFDVRQTGCVYIRHNERLGKHFALHGHPLPHFFLSTRREEHSSLAGITLHHDHARIDSTFNISGAPHDEKRAEA